MTKPITNIKIMHKPSNDLIAEIEELLALAKQGKVNQAMLLFNIVGQ